MNEQDVSSTFTVADSTPEQAAENIKNAGFLNTSPDSYKQLAPYLKPEVEAQKTPAIAPPAVADFTAKSFEHASLIKRDAPKLNALERYMRFAGNTIRGKSIGRDIADLSYRLAEGEVLTREERFKLYKLNRDLKKLNTSEEPEYGFLASLPVETIGMATDMAEGIYDNIDLVLKGAGTGTAMGAVAAGPAGALGGAITGASLGASFAFFRDTYRQTTGHLYNDLTRVLKETDELKLPKAEYERRAIAKGAGALSAAIGLLPIGKLAKNVPWVKKFLNPRSFLKYAMTAEGKAWGGFMKTVGQQMAAEGFEEGAQEFIQILGERMGETWDGSETSFTEAFSRTVSDWSTAERVAKAGVVGAVGGAALGAGAEVVAAPINKGVKAAQEKLLGKGERPIDVAVPPDVKKMTDLTGPNVNLPNAIKGTKALQLQAMLIHGKQIVDESDLKNLAPAELDELRKRMYDEAGVPYVWINKDEAQVLATEKPEAADAMQDLLGFDPHEQSGPKVIRIEAHKFQNAVDLHTEFAGIAQSDPELLSANEFMRRYQEATEKRKELLKNAPRAEGPDSSQLSLVIEDELISSEEDYLAQPTFTPNLEMNLPETEVAKLHNAQLDARRAVVEAINDAAESEMQEVKDVMVELAVGATRENEGALLKHDPKIKMVERFMYGYGVILTPEQIALRSKGIPPYAIDPSSLPKEVVARFKAVENIKRRKVFNKDGVPAFVAAEMMGAKNVDDLLETLAYSPTLAEAMDKHAESMSGEIEEEALKETNYNLTAIEKAYNNMASLHLKESKHLFKKAAAAVKTGIKIVANPLRRIPELDADALNLVRATPVRQLNANEAKVNERQAHKEAVKAFIKNNFHWFSEQKETAALYALVAKHTHLAIRKVNKANKFLARLKSSDVQAILLEAGPAYVEAVESITDYFDFYSSGRRREDIDNFHKFAARLKRDGRGDITMPEVVKEWMAEKQSARDLTADQYVYLVDKLRSVVHQARLKNELMGAYHQGQLSKFEEVAAHLVHEKLKQHKSYDAKKATIGQGVIPPGERVDRKIRQGLNVFSNVEAIVTKLDDGVKGGLLAQMIYHPLKGIGLFQGAFGEMATNNLRRDVKAEFNKHVEAYGRKDFKQLHNTKVTVPEFADIDALRNGNLTKANLLTMLMHMGTVTNREALANFGVEPETIMTVLKRELQQRDFDFVQNAVWNVFKSFKPRIAALEKMTKGVDIEFIPPLSFGAFDKQYEGGYMPLKYLKDSTPESVRDVADKRFKEASTKERQDYGNDDAYEGIVHSPHTISRVGSEWHVDLSLDTLAIGMEQVVYDLTMRVPVRDVMQLLLNQSIASDIMAIGGQEDYSTLTSAVAEATRSYHADRMLLYTEQGKLIDKVARFTESAAAATQILFSVPSMAIQLVSMTNVVQNMGLGGSKYIANAALKILNPMHRRSFKEFYERAAEIDPSIQSYREGIDDNYLAGLSEHLPKKRKFTNKPYNLLKSGLETINEFGYKRLLGGIDVSLKVVTTHAAYSQFMAGDAPGHSKESIEKMSKSEREAAARAYAAQISASSLTAGTTLDRAAVQKHALGRTFALYWNDARNKLNTNLQATRNVKNRFKTAVEKAQAGDIEGANEAFAEGADTILTMMVLSVVSIMFQSIARGNNPVDEEDEEIPLLSAETVEKIPEYLTKKLTTMDGAVSLLDDMFFQNLIGIRDIRYTVAHYFDYGKTRAVGTPMTKVMTDAGDAFITLYQMYALREEMGLIEMAEELNQKQLKSLLSTGGLLVGGLPVNGAFKVYNAISELELDGGYKPLTVPEREEKAKEETVQAIDQFVEKHDKTGSDKFKAYLERRRGKRTQLQEAVDDAKSIRDQLVPPPEDLALGAEALQHIKYVESAGDRYAENKKSGALGLYQFLRSTWRDVMTKAPELGLTPGGRTDPEQQEKAMRWLVQDNARQLRRERVPINAQSIYGAHHFGAPKWIRIMQSPDDTDIRTILPKSNFEANDWLEGVKTVGDLKAAVTKLLAKGQALYEKAKKDGKVVVDEPG